MRKGYVCEHRGNVTRAECMECCESWQSPCHLRPPLMHAFFKFIEHRPEDLISLTTLQGCPRAFHFKLTLDWYESYRAKTKAFWGTLFHIMAEDYKGHGDVVEQRFGYPMSTKYGEFVLTFQPDRIVPRHNFMMDIKTTGNVPRKSPWTNHRRQAEAYVLMLNSTKLLIEKPPYSGNFEPHPPFSIDWVQILYIDWARINTRWEGGGVFVKPFDPTPYDLFVEPGKGQTGLMDDALDIFQERLDLFLDVKNGVLPTYATMKEFAERQDNWPLWMCSWGSGGCDFKDHCRFNTISEERASVETAKEENKRKGEENVRNLDGQRKG